MQMECHARTTCITTTVITGSNILIVPSLKTARKIDNINRTDITAFQCSLNRKLIRTHLDEKFALRQVVSHEPAQIFTERPVNHDNVQDIMNVAKFFHCLTLYISKASKVFSNYLQVALRQNGI